MSNGVIGLDLGTTSAKAVVFSLSGEVISEVEKTYPIHHPKPQWAEQNPVEVEQAALDATREAILASGFSGGELSGIGISAAMHSWLPIDQSGNPLRDAIIWADGRSSAIADALNESGEGIWMYQETGTPVHPMSPFVKTRWIKENEPEVFRRAAKWISLKEYITGRWFHEQVIDYSIASATGLFDFRQFTWSHNALEACGLQKKQLNRPVPPTYRFKKMDEAVARTLGVPRDIPVIIGGSDGPLANLGMGATSPGDMAVTIGTSGAVRQMSQTPDASAEGEVFCYAFTEDLWLTGGPTNNGGIALQWLRDLFSDGDHSDHEQLGYDDLISLAKPVPIGAEGLIFHPWLNGERAPLWDADARGSFTGLGMIHRKSHLARAVLEGILYNVMHIHEAVELMTEKTVNLYAGGGFSRSPFWVQMLSDMTGYPVKLPVSHQSSAWGAAWLSLYAIGEVPSLESIRDSVPMAEPVMPDLERHKKYQEVYRIYRCRM